MLAIHAISNKDEKNESQSTGITTYHDPTTEFHIEQRVRQLLGHQQDPNLEDEMRIGSRGKKSFFQRDVYKHLTTFLVVSGHIGTLFLCRFLSLKYLSK
jgi:hypothetical protein